MLSKETLDRAKQLDKEYFGDREMARLVKALSAQVKSMEKEPTLTNLRKQFGDVLFILASFERNTGWELDQLLADALVKIEKRRAERHYYEAHITVEPVFDEQLTDFKKVCQEYGFHVATLLMKKRKEDKAERSANDSFATGRSISYSDLEDRMLKLVQTLSEKGFKVWRYKIESTLLDSRYNDEMLTLEEDNLPEKERNPRSPADGALSGKKTKIKR